MQDPLETYKRRAGDIVGQFTRYIITFPECVTRLADELTTAKKDIDSQCLPELADAMLPNNARIMGELERRGNKRRTDARYKANHNGPTS